MHPFILQPQFCKYLKYYRDYDWFHWSLPHYHGYIVHALKKKREIYNLNNSFVVTSHMFGDQPKMMEKGSISPRQVILFNHRYFNLIIHISNFRSFRVIASVTDTKFNFGPSISFMLLYGTEWGRWPIMKERNVQEKDTKKEVGKAARPVGHSPIYNRY